MQTETQWNLKMAEIALNSAQKAVSPAEAHQLQAAIEIIKSVSQKVGGE